MSLDKRVVDTKYTLKISVFRNQLIQLYIFGSYI